MSEEVKNRFQVKGRTKVINGSILAPQNAGLRFILNVANTAGKQESPLYPLFEKKWKKLREEARGWYVTKTGAYKLGAISTVALQSDVWAINMLCQNDDLQTDVKALAECLKKVCASAKYEKATLHVSTLLTNAIPELVELCNLELLEKGVSVFFYEENAA